MNSQLTPRPARPGSSHAPVHVGAGAAFKDNNKMPVYVAIGGGVVGGAAGAFMAPTVPGRILWGGGGLLIGALAGGLGTSLVQQAMK
jgi:hypothetical protein